MLCYIFITKLIIYPLTANLFDDYGVFVSKKLLYLHLNYIRRLENSNLKTIATIGTFDGLHTGHRRVLDLMKSLASQRRLRPLVVTFDRHPLETVAPERAPGLILNPSEKIDRLRKEGLELNIIEFTPEIASVSAREWMKKLRDEEGVKILVVGYDNTFGCDGVNMSLSDIERTGEELGIEVVEAPLENGVSSSAVRRLVSAGKMDEAETKLGRPFELSGKVVHGRALGRTIGFPTINVAPDYRACLPRPGVYEADALLEDGRRFSAVVNVGSQPTVAAAAPVTVEAHLIDFSGDLYDRKVTLRFKRFIRDEQRFPDLDSLRRQIERDVAEVEESDIQLRNR